MNFFIGVDIEDTKRFKLKKGKMPVFFKKIFTKDEITYCMGKRFPEQHFAARFAAKEAVLKAMSEMGVKKPPIYKLEVGKNKYSSPIMKPFLNTKLDIKISLSHTESSAVAIALIVKK